MEIIIEQLTRGNKLIGCHKFSQAQVNIGRAYDNDVIVADPHVCPEHLAIHFDGNDWIIDDVNSVNGSYLEGTKSPVKQHVVKSGDIVYFGKSLIRLIFPSHPVAQSIPFSPFEQLVDFARKPLVMTFNLVLFTLLIAWTIFLNKPIEVSFAQLAVPAIGMVLAFSMWPALVALISHLTKNDARVLQQLGICFIFFNLFWLSDSLESIIYFNTSANMSLANAIGFIPIAIAFSMFWLNCYIGFHMSEVRRIVAASTLTVLLFGGSFAVDLSKRPEFSPMPHYDSTIMAPEFLFTPSSSVDEFIQSSESLFEDTHEQAQSDKQD